MTPPKNEKESGSQFFNYFEFLLFSEIEASVCQSQLIFLDSPFSCLLDKWLSNGTSYCTYCSSISMENGRISACYHDISMCTSPYKCTPIVLISVMNDLRTLEVFPQAHRLSPNYCELKNYRVSLKKLVFRISALHIWHFLSLCIQCIQQRA